MDVTCCGTCCTTSGVAEGGLVPEARVGSIHDLVAATARCDKPISF